MLQFPYNVTNLIVPVVLRADDNSLITGVSFGDGDLSVEYMLPGESGYTPITLVTAAAGTYTASGWIEVSSSGLYQLGLPVAALNPNSYVILKVSYAANSPQFITIQFTGALNAVTTRAPANVAAVNGYTLIYGLYSPVQILRGLASMLAGNLTASGTTLRDPGNNKDVLVATVTGGNRTISSVDFDE